MEYCGSTSSARCMYGATRNGSSVSLSEYIHDPLPQYANEQYDSSADSFSLEHTHAKHTVSILSHDMHDRAVFTHDTEAYPTSLNASNIVNTACERNPFTFYPTYTAGKSAQDPCTRNSNPRTVRERHEFDGSDYTECNTECTWRAPLNASAAASDSCESILSSASTGSYGHAPMGMLNWRTDRHCDRDCARLPLTQPHQSWRDAWSLKEPIGDTSHMPAARLCSNDPNSNMHSPCHARTQLPVRQDESAQEEGAPAQCYLQLALAMSQHAAFGAAAPSTW